MVAWSFLNPVTSTIKATYFGLITLAIAILAQPMHVAIYIDYS